MGIFAFLVLGLIAGAIARVVLPNRISGGWFITLTLGVVGALLGGWLGSTLLGASINEFWSLQSWALAVGGALVALLLYGVIAHHRTKDTTGTD